MAAHTSDLSGGNVDADGPDLHRTRESMVCTPFRNNLCLPLNMYRYHNAESNMCANYLGVWECARMRGCALAHMNVGTRMMRGGG